MDPEHAARLVERLASIGVILSSAEWLAQSQYFEDAGILGWPHLRLRTRWILDGRLGKVLGWLGSYRATIGSLALRLIAALLLLTIARTDLERMILVAILACSALFLSLRMPIGTDGSDQMSCIVFVTLALSYIVRSRAAVELALWFLASQACLSYATSGILKLTDRGWLDGTYLARVLSARTYGASPVGRWLMSHLAVSAWLSRGIVVCEAVFPCVLVAPSSLRLALLCAGISFHVACAILMGLNTFVFAFIATYPAIIYCSQEVGVFAR